VSAENIMTIAAILVHVHAAPETRGRLECAAALARRFDATLIGVGAQMIPPLAVDYGPYSLQGDWYEVVGKAVQDDLTRAHAAFDAASVDLKKPTIWESGIQLPAAALACASRAADLIVAGAAPGWRENLYADAAVGELVVTSGRPVLVAASTRPTSIGERIVLAWKDTREARRALSDAMPFFERAKEVLVLEVCSKDEVADAELRTADVVSALVRRGIAARASVVPGGDAGKEILRQADAFDAGLVVAGGYGHNRLGEWVFGGVTRDLIGQHTHHVLLSH
jgi:nucleotide-binding universal stress UspA family protein